MKCQHENCRAWTEVLETRRAPGGMTRRRYACANGHRFTTLEYALAYRQAHGRRPNRQEGAV